ncbi:hypothetical protein [Arthrobacter zhaoguopingii]|uniref:hypothetical protein n=1 Tax=Arthrobacter zhaoguopingii TaxID=2681491 RepID=UPI00135C21FA|nr:hypothetical protein [Arthrobacter zhaoguopingii]
MKYAALTAVLSLLLLTGCGAEQLSTADTCAELRAIVAGYSDDLSKGERKDLAEQMQELAKTASDPLKDEVKLVADYAAKGVDGEDELSAKESDKMDSAGEKVSEACGFDDL